MTHPSPSFLPLLEGETLTKGDPMSAKMIAEEGSLAGLVVSLDEGKEWILGRSPQATILIADPLAGDRHVRLSILDEEMQVEPLEGNNVEINDEEVLETHLLHHGDVLKIGSSRFRFYREIGDTELGAKEPTSDLMAGMARPPKSPAKATPVLSHPAEPIIDPKKPLSEDEGASKDTPSTPENLSTAAKTSPAKPDADVAFAADETPLSSEELLSHIDFGIDDTSPFVLKVIRGPNNGAEFPMELNHSYVLGTDPQVCDVVFHDMSISRQHARITVAQDQSLSIEDLSSRNGTMVDETKITGKSPLGEHIIVILGTTSFIVFNRESERSTIITPFLPSIVRSLHDDTEKKPATESTMAPITPPQPIAQPPIEIPVPPPPQGMSTMKKRLLIGLASALVLLFAVGTSTLFQTRTFVAPAHNTTQEIETTLKAYPNLQYSYNKESKRLFLIGHVLSAGDRTQLMYALESLPFVRTVDDENLIIDEYVLKETNQILNKTPAWAGVSMRTTAPGRFMISGYLKKRRDFEQLKDFLVQDFRYLDRLDNRVIVEEAVVANSKQIIDQAGFHNVTVTMNNGEMSLEGSIPPDSASALEKTIEQIRKQSGIHAINNYVTVSMSAPHQAYIDLTSTYHVTGSASVGGKNVSVFINGRILSPGDILDGMTVTSIERHMILLEKDGVQYRIEYNK